MLCVAVKQAVKPHRRLLDSGWSVLVFVVTDQVKLFVMEGLVCVLDFVRSFHRHCCFEPSRGGSAKASSCSSKATEICILIVLQCLGTGAHVLVSAKECFGGINTPQGTWGFPHMQRPYPARILWAGRARSRREPQQLSSFASPSCSLLLSVRGKQVSPFPVWKGLFQPAPLRLSAFHFSEQRMLFFRWCQLC